jgi:hypothetical protein
MVGHCCVDALNESVFNWVQALPTSRLCVFAVNANFSFSHSQMREINHLQKRDLAPDPDAIASGLR